MENIKQITQKLLELIGLNEPSIEFNQETNKLIVFVNEGEWIKTWLPNLVADFERLINLAGKRNNLPMIFVDINNYRKERENIIVELAKAAARKVLATKQEVRLPAMNAYERRLIHVELSTRPDVKSESAGEGRERCVIVKPL